MFRQEAVKKSLVISLIVVLANTWIVPITQAAGLVSSYVKFITNFQTTQIPYPTNDVDLEFQVQLSNPNSDVDQINFYLIDASGAEIDSDYAYFSYGDPSTKITKQSLRIYSWQLKKNSLPLSIVTKVVFTQESGKLSLSDSQRLNVKQPDVNVSCISGKRLVLGKNVCPAGSTLQSPQSTSAYVNFVTDLQGTAIPYPTKSTSFDFQVELVDPNDDLSEVDFELIDANGKKLSSATSYLWDSAGPQTFTETFNIYSFDLETMKLPLSVLTSVIFTSSSGKSKLTSTFTLNVKGPDVPVQCSKSGKTITAQNSCPSGYTLVKYPVLSDANLNLLSRMPGNLKNKKFTVYACIAQFDATTGGSTFRAYLTNKPASSYYSGVNSLFTGSAKSLLSLRENDSFVANVTVTGSTKYKTIGGYITVPKLSIQGFIKTGSC